MALCSLLKIMNVQLIEKLFFPFNVQITCYMYEQ